MDQSQGVALIMVPFPAQGHLNQLLHFSLNLLSLSNGHGNTNAFSIHYAASPVHIRQAKHRLHGWNDDVVDKIHFHELPLPSLPTPPPNPNSTNKFPSHLIPSFDAAMQLQAPLGLLLNSLSIAYSRLVVIHDTLMSFAGYEAASLVNAESYSFYCTPAFYGLSPLWDEQENPMTDASEEALDVIATPLQDCYPQEFDEHVEKNTFDTPRQAGLLVNSCRAVEAEFLDLIADGSYLQPHEKLFAIGPVNPLAVLVTKAVRDRHECLQWLDRQPLASVIYVSFGSTSTISDDQIEQLAIGLQRSGQRFIWVLRDADRGDVFVEKEKWQERKLPKGFAEELQGRGILVKGWAPQLEILAHTSTGAFVSHCGWNSCMESLSLGVPIVAWPMHSDQPRNGIMVTNYLKVGVTMRNWADREKVVSSVDVEETIKRVMVYDEGKEIRKRVQSLSEAILVAVSEGGSSRADMDLFIAHITR